MNNKIIKVNPEDIILAFDVEEKKYCALKSHEDNETIYFAMISSVKENHFVVTSILDSELKKVIETYDKIIEFLESEDELDIKEEE